VSTPVRVLVVDDEPFITDVVSSALVFEGFATEEATTGAEALSRARSGAFDCIVLDVMLPDGDGFSVCRTLRAEAITTPVLFLTARDAGSDKLAGLALGDDYVTKPFSIDELVARIRAVLRRTGTVDDACRLRLADLVVDTEERTVSRAGESIDLSQILEAVWGDGYDGESNIVETYISYVRKKVDRFEPPLIHTVRGVGYAMREPRS
jgi:two-component system OmpR family response regulator